MTGRAIWNPDGHDQFSAKPGFRQFGVTHWILIETGRSSRKDWLSLPIVVE